MQCQALHHPCATNTTVITYGENGTQGDQIQFLQKRHLKPLRCLWVSYLVVAASIKGHKPLITQHHFCRCFGYPVASRLALDDYLYSITESSSENKNENKNKNTSKCDLFLVSQQIRNRSRRQKSHSLSTFSSYGTQLHQWEMVQLSNYAFPNFKGVTIVLIFFY